MNVSLEYSEHILPIHIEILKNFLIQINRKNIPVELYGRKAGELFRKVKDYGPFCYTEFDLLSYKNSIRFLEKHPDYCKSLGFRISWSPDVNEFKNLLFKNKKLIEQIYTLYIGIHLESLSNIYNALPDFTKLRHLVIKNLHFDLDLTLLNLRELLISAGKKGIKITIPSMTNLRYLVINPSSQSVITIAPQVNLQNLSIRYSKFIKFQLKISPKISPFILNSLFELMVYDNDSSFQDPLFPALKKIKTSETTTQFSHNKVTVLFNNEETMPKAFSNKLLKKGAKSLNQFNNFINKNIIYPFNALAFCPTTRAQPNEPETQKVTPDTNK